MREKEKQLWSDKENETKEFSKEELKELENIHEKIRSVLIDYNCEEFGDCIIDEICEAVGIPPTTVYYED